MVKQWSREEMLTQLGHFLLEEIEAGDWDRNTIEYVVFKGTKGYENMTDDELRHALYTRYKCVTDHQEP